MSETGRRKFLAVAGAGTAAGVIGLTAGPAAARTTRRHDGSATESVVAYVEDPTSDEVVLMVGDDEVVVHDLDLVNRLLNAAGGQ
ncbi:hypothetical protein SAMN04488570_1087 [Nocardioides scoriae]|uniref:Tat (Twin-arginine translocation) pathway signal sequence n=1 Tax=Nocardioides scoriae TaxID=642780 RepID=A0A1H1PAL6_9ACTN|nr:hypothetical protein [Nocardioides scoriae]SDS08197.1 hypothetical protein SAMN04488570_1087 [Nocardioides scoriae]